METTFTEFFTELDWLELAVEEKDPGALVSALSRAEDTPLRGLRWTAVSPRATREELV